MKFCTYHYQDAEQVGVLSQDGKSVLPLKQFGLGHADMHAFIADTTDESLQKLAGQWAAAGEGVALSQVTLDAPIPVPRQDVICLGLNYSAHAKEANAFSGNDFAGDAHAIYFSKRVDRAVAPGGAINGHFDLTHSLDYEAELAVVIGKEARNVAPGQAREHVFGYTILNDVTARDLQTDHKQWYFGKSLDGFTPMGPWIVTVDEFAFPPAVRLQSFVNGEPRQDANTETLIFGIDHIICELSAGIALAPGTIIATGTPAGVGMGFKPPIFLQKGDVVECRIEGIGTLVNTIR